MSALAVKPDASKINLLSTHITNQNAWLQLTVLGSMQLVVTRLSLAPALSLLIDMVKHDEGSHEQTRAAASAID